MALYGKPPMMLPDPQDMMGQLRGDNDYAHPDPNAHAMGNIYRAQAVQDYMQRQGVPNMQGIQRPGMKTEQDFRKQFDYNEPTDPLQDPGPSSMPPSPEQLQEADEASKLSDEDLLARVQKSMNQPRITGDKAKDYQALDAIEDPAERQEWKDQLDDFYEGTEENMNDRDEPDNEDDLRKGR